MSFRLPSVSFEKSSEPFLNLLIENRNTGGQQKIREKNLKNKPSLITDFCSMMKKKSLCIHVTYFPFILPSVHFTKILLKELPWEEPSS